MHLLKGISFRLIGLALAIGLLSIPVQASQETILSRESGVADRFEWLNQDFHYVDYALPQAWTQAFPEEVQFYGHRYGDVSGRKGTIVFWGEENPSRLASRARQLNGNLVVLATKQFDLTMVPENPGWVSIPVDTFKLPLAFAVSLYTFSDETNGVKIGLSPKASGTSNSSSTHPGKDGKWTAFKPLREGRNWLLRVKIRDSLQPQQQLDPADLQGRDFLTHDDGTAEGYVTLRKRGFLLRCEADQPRKIQSIYLHGKLDGNWFGTDRKLTVMILDRDLKVLSRTQVPYQSFTNLPSWQEVKFSPVQVGTLHYISIEPSSTASVQFMLGYDSSGKNRGSSHGTTGSMLAWPFPELIEDSTNWMVRVRYAP